MICWQSRGFHNAQSTTRTTCSSPGDAGKDEPARTRCHEGTKPNLKEKTVAMKLSPHKTDPGGAAKPHCPAAASPHTPLPASLCQGTPAAVVYVRSFTKPQLLHTPEGRLGVAKGCLETPGPPRSSTEPSPGTETWHKLGALLAGAGINKGFKGGLPPWN